MREEFARRRGYDLTPFLATFAKRTVGSEKETAKFRAHFDATIRDLYRDVHFALTSKMLKDAGLVFSSEPYGGPWRSNEVLPYVQNVMTEFWTREGKYVPYCVDQTVAALRKNQARTSSRPRHLPAGPRTVPGRKPPPGSNRLAMRQIARVSTALFSTALFRNRGTTATSPATRWASGEPTSTGPRPGGSRAKRGEVLATLPSPAAMGPRRALDFTGDGAAVCAIHRRSEAADVWFVANLERAHGETRCSFKVSGKQPELWDPGHGCDVRVARVRGDRRPDDRAADLRSGGKASSWCSEEKHKGTQAQRQKGRGIFRELKPVMELPGPWETQFDPKWGGPANAVTFDTLTDWTSNSGAGIKYYSGTATYRKTFDAEPAVCGLKSAVCLDLGTVNHLARVRLNGKDLGVAWTAPWCVQIPAGLLQPKGNRLEIEVTNVWANRLIGDEQEPPDCEWSRGHMGGQYLKMFPDWFVKGQPRPSKGRYCFTTWNYFTKNSPLVPSGLLGPVRVMAEQ